MTFLELESGQCTSLFHYCNPYFSIRSSAWFASPHLVLIDINQFYEQIYINFIFIFSCMFSPSPTPFPHSPNLSEFNIQCDKISLHWTDMLHIILLGSGLVFLFWFILLYLGNQVNFVTFNTNLSLFKKNLNTTFPKQ